MVGGCALTIDHLFIEYSVSKLDQLTARIQECLERLSEDQVWARGSESENAIGNLVLHLSGNVRQWIVSGVGGETDTRVRDQEFAAHGGMSRQELTERLHQSIEDAKAVLASVTADRLIERVTIQKYDLAVLHAVYHVVEHFAQHTGQIIFATKMLTGEDLGFYKHLRAAAHTEKTP